MGVADLAVIAILVLSGLVGLSLGVARVVLGLCGWVGAGFATLYGFTYVRPIARGLIDSTLIADAASGIALFVVSLIVLTAISHVIGDRVSASGFGSLNRSLGLAVGIAIGAVIVSGGFLVLLRVMELPRDHDEWPRWMQAARSAPLVQRGADIVASLLPRDWKVDSRTVRPIFDPKAGERAMQRLLAPETKESPPEEKSGYNERERKEMERLIRSNE